MKILLVAAASIFFVLSALAEGQTGTADEQIPSAGISSGLQAARSLVGPAWPAGTGIRSTTEGRIYINNLNSQIAALTAQLQQRSEDHLISRLALNYYHRFQVLGRMEDAEKARELLMTASQRPHEAVVDLAYAQVLIGFHEFDMATAALDDAILKKAKPESVSALKQAIDRATGKRHTQLGAAAFMDGSVTELSQLVTLAAQSINYGNTAQASLLLKTAQDSYTGSAPYLISWIQVQQGILFLRHEDYYSAEKFFRSAHERFPEYALATEHLAETQYELGQYAHAAKLYLQVAEQTGNPEFWYQLAKTERALSLTRQSDKHFQMAGTKYASLIQRYPTMYADHAARYYLDLGDATKAFELAQQNYAQRQDVRASTLLLETGLAAGDKQSVCSQLQRIQNLGYTPPELPSLVTQTGAKCANF